VHPTGETGIGCSSAPAKCIVASYTKRRMSEQWIKKFKDAIKRTRVSCRTFAVKAVRFSVTYSPAMPEMFSAPDGRGRNHTANVPVDFTPHRGIMAATAISASVKRLMPCVQEQPNASGTYECQGKWPDRPVDLDSRRPALSQTWTSEESRNSLSFTQSGASGNPGSMVSLSAWGIAKTN